MEGVTNQNHVGAWTLGELIRAADLSRFLSPDAAALPVSAVSDDSRDVGAGGCFVAHAGSNRDGHEYIEAAVRNGATSVVVERAGAVPAGAVEIVVPDGRIAIAKLAAAFHGLSSPRRSTPLRLIGITGTNGKSTTCELLRAILQAAGERAALLGTIRYDLVDGTVASSLTTPPAPQLCAHLARAARGGAGWAVMEVSSHALDQRRCDGLTFRAGVFTNLSGDHLDYHKDLASYAAAKARLFTRLGDGAVALVNADDQHSETMLAGCRTQVVRYGLQSKRADVTAEVESLTADGSRYRIVGPDYSIEVRSKLIGRHNVMNALAAAATARAVGIPDDAIRRGIEDVAVVRGRLERVSVDGAGDGPFAVFVDYAHTDDALRNALASLRPLTNGRLICVFGCGGDRDRTKRPRMAAAVEEVADVAVVTSDNPRTEEPAAIVEDILTGFSSDGRSRAGVDLDRAAAIQLALTEAQAGDIVLIAGKGHEDYQIIGTTRRHFDDVEVAQACLRSRFGCPEAVS